MKRCSLIWSMVGMISLMILAPMAAYGEVQSIPALSQSLLENFMLKSELTVPVAYYKEKDVPLPKDHQVAVKIAQKLAQKLNIQVKPDINDAKFREVVYMAALNLEHLTPYQQKTMVAYAKYVDVYENKWKNQRIRELEKKWRLGTITPDEEEELQGLLPIPDSPKLAVPKSYSPKGKIQSPDVIANNGYHRFMAREYAYKWWNKRNNEEYGYYSRANGGCYDCWADCTNFASQIVKVGGIKQVRSGSTVWYYSDQKPSISWGVANGFFRHFKTRAELANKAEELEIGDIINVDFDGDKDIEHSAAITKKDNMGIYVTYHSNDTKDRTIADWLMLFNVYGWKMGSVKN
ncbi:amidase domain-containing protein [Thermoflavimicrobium dichotomicum]|uniref:Putative amidase domain-containing protein n=1 Tax=Thermoflavimicrobium dichotomicum TaxID=46223 RepID=A0A1I3T1Y5_9BACL|nr:amidase domain-containing protein [Thermoflavimicrobium dichotomicum]SFJ64690.1 Putative amidase domain-containing protein [Thermoflavimicrobium dichotomicum]